MHNLALYLIDDAQVLAFFLQQIAVDLGRTQEGLALGGRFQQARLILRIELPGRRFEAVHHSLGQFAFFVADILVL